MKTKLRWISLYMSKSELGVMLCVTSSVAVQARSSVACRNLNSWSSNVCVFVYWSLNKKYYCTSFCMSQSEQEVGLMLAVTLYVAICKQNNNLICPFACRDMKREVMLDVTLYITLQGAHVKRNVRNAYRRWPSSDRITGEQFLIRALEFFSTYSDKLPSSEYRG
jgi:hypothetical protein